MVIKAKITADNAATSMYGESLNQPPQL